MIAERALIGCLILDSTKFEYVSNYMNYSYLTDTDSIHAFQIMAQLSQAQKSWDGVTLSHCSEKIDYEGCMGLVDNCLSVEMIDEYLSIVLQNYARRQIPVELEQVLIDHDKIRKLLENPEKVIDKQKEISMADLYDSAIKSSHESIVNDIEMPMPYETVNAMTNGLPKQSLIFIGGNSSHGKSQMLMNIVVNLLNHNKKCLLVDYEMKLENIIHRIAAISSKIPLSHFIQGRTVYGQPLSDPQINEVDKLLKYHKNKYKDLLIIRDNLKEDEIRTAIIKHEPDFVSIDHIQLYAQLIPRNKNDSMALHVSGLCAKLKDMAKTHNVTMVCPSQVSRATKEALPNMSDLKESGGIEENADIVFTVFIPYNVSKNPADRCQFKFQIAKNRNGPIGLIDLNIDHQTGQITENKFYEHEGEL